MIVDEGDSTWLYLSRAIGSEPERDGWLFNSPSAPPEPDFEACRSAAMPPHAPASLVAEGGVRPTPRADQWSVRWSPNGDAVAVAVDGLAVGAISIDEEQGWSRFLKAKSPWGLPWDERAITRALGAGDSRPP